MTHAPGPKPIRNTKDKKKCVWGGRRGGKLKFVIWISYLGVLALGACLKRTVAWSPAGSTEEDHDPSVPAHTESGGGGLRVQYVHVSGSACIARTMLKGH
ncbi:hypothetical protein evm_007392 [Chilo suppressalis]|nr:hypothetical protein evm_007392 [Chilo suppressalis]